MKSTPKPGDLRERALRLLARREHSRWELTRKLESSGFSIDEIAPLLDEFEEKNWLSDQRFAKSWVADHRATTGSVKLAYELRQRGVRDSIIEAVLSENHDSEFERAREVWKKKFGAPSADAASKARQIRFLQSRGFTPELVRKICGHRGNEF